VAHHLVYKMKTYSDLYKNKKINAWLDITTNCNAACPQCHRTDPKTLKKVGWLPTYTNGHLKNLKLHFLQKH